MLECDYCDIGLRNVHAATFTECKVMARKEGWKFNFNGCACCPSCAAIKARLYAAAAERRAKDKSVKTRLGIANRGRFR